MTKDTASNTCNLFIAIICISSLIILLEIIIGLYMFKEIKSKVDKEFLMKFNFDGEFQHQMANKENKNEIKHLLEELLLIQHRFKKRDTADDLTKEIKEICKTVHEHCKTGPIGITGIAGIPGRKGDRGYSGSSRIRGKNALRGKTGKPETSRLAGPQGPQGPTGN